MQTFKPYFSIRIPAILIAIFLIQFSFKTLAEPSWVSLPDNINVKENTTSVHTVVASDSTGKSVEYLIAGTDNTLFTLGKSSGKLKFKKAPDREDPKDNGKNNIYNLIIKAKSSGTTIKKDITVTVRDLDDEKPRLTNHKSKISVFENLNKAYTFQVDDPDTKDSKITLSLDSNTKFPDKNRFTISGKSLMFKSPPDFEKPNDKNEDNEYKILLDVADPGDNKRSYQVTVQVKNRKNFKVSYVSTTKDNITMDYTTPSRYMDDRGSLLEWGKNPVIGERAYGTVLHATVPGWAGWYLDDDTGKWMMNFYDDVFYSVHEADAKTTIRLDQEEEDAACDGTYYTVANCDLHLYVYKRNHVNSYSLYDSITSSDKTKTIVLPRETEDYLIRVSLETQSYHVGKSSYVLHFYKGNSNAPSSAEDLKAARNAFGEIDQDALRDSSSILSGLNTKPRIIADDIIPDQILISRKKAKKNKKQSLAQKKLSKSDQQFIKFAKKHLVSNKAFTKKDLTKSQLNRLREILGLSLLEDTANNADSINGEFEDNLNIIPPGSDAHLIQLIAFKLNSLIDDYEFKPNQILHKHAKFSADPDYYSYQEKYLNLINFPEGIDSAGAEVKDVIVAVVDTGGPSIGSTAWKTSAFVNKGQYDFVSDVSNAGDGDSEDDDATDPGAKHDGDYSGNTSHGTHVGTTIAAKNDGRNINGYGVKAVHLRVLGVGGWGTSDDICNAIAYASNQSNDTGKTFKNESDGKKISVINMSLGGGSSCACQSIYTTAYERGITVVASAGNGASYTDGFPAACDNVLSISAADSTGTKSWYSNYSESVDLSAPGGDTDNDWINHVDGIYAFSKDEKMALWQGTSMAAPNAAGVIANIYAENSNANAKFIEDLLKQRLITKKHNEEKSLFYGHGIVDLERAVGFAGKSKKSVTGSMVKPSYINLSTNSKLNFKLKKQGSGTIKITNIETDHDGTSIKEVNVNNNGWGTYQVKKTNSSFNRNDRYVGKVTVTLSNGFSNWTESIPLLYQIGTNADLNQTSALDFVHIRQKLINGRETLKKYDHDGTLDETLNIEQGTYNLCQSTDIDHDGIYCEFGEIGYLQAGQNVSSNTTIKFKASPFFE